MSDFALGNGFVLPEDPDGMSIEADFVPGQGRLDSIGTETDWSIQQFALMESA